MGGSYSAPPKKEVKYFDSHVEALPSMQGKNVAITGTTTGLGFHAAKAVLLKGGNVYCLNRPSERADKALAELQAAAPDGATATAVDCDLQSFEAVRKAAATLTEKLAGQGLDVLCNNAGIMALPDKATADGYNHEMQTNHLSHFLLTSELMDALKTAVSKRGSARVVNHSSAARTGPKALDAKFLGKNVGDLGGDGQMARTQRYGQTKLANAVFTNALQDHIDEKGLNIICATAAPGLAASSLQVTSAAGGANMLFPLLMWFSQSAEDGALPLITCIAGPDVRKRELIVPRDRGVLGPVFKDGVTGPPVKVAHEATSTDAGAKKALWKASEEACGPFKL